jgi:hypothetical protein
MEFEDWPTLSLSHRIVEIDTIHDMNALDTERNASREQAEDVRELPNMLRRVQIGHSDFFAPAAHSDGRAASGAQIADLLNVAPVSPDPPPARDLNDRHRRGTRQTALPPTNGN